MKIGLDIGSTTIKCVVLDDALNITYKTYERHFSHIVEKAAELVQRMHTEVLHGAPAQLSISGSAGMGLADACGVPFVQEVFATRVAAKRYAPDADVVIELGGEDAKILFLTGGTEVRMNGSCAGGTGAFIDQMATLLKMTPDEMNEAARHAEKTYTIASRCGVFAKSDIQPLINQGRYFLEKPRGGKGILLGGVPGVKPAKVFVIGAGVVGTAAARTAAGTGADVTICDISLQRLTYLADVMPKNVKTLMSSEYNIREELKRADLVVGSVLIPGAKAPKLVTRDMLKEMEPGTVMVDVAIDQGGCFETSRPTTHEDPVYYVDGILHYCVANIPGAVPYTSTLALTNATLPYAIQLADKGWRRACRENRELELGLNIVQGKVVYKPVADAWGLDYEPLTL